LPCQKKAGDAPALQKINQPAHKSFHFGAITSRDYTSQPLKPPMWRNGRRNGLKIADLARKNGLRDTAALRDFAQSPVTFPLGPTMIGSCPE
jgi:hypothetical protein